MPKRPYPRWQRRHEGILLWLLQRPWANLKQCAEATGYSHSQVSRIVNSPGFQRRYRAACDAALLEAARTRFQKTPEGGAKGKAPSEAAT